MKMTRRTLFRATGAVVGAAAVGGGASPAAAAQPTAGSVAAAGQGFGTPIDYSFFTGQSLACGAGNGPALITTPRYPGDVSYLDPAGALQGLISGYYPRYTDREYPATSFGNANFAASGRQAVVNLHAEGGQSYAELRKGGTSGKYEEAIATYRAGVTANPGKSFTARTMQIVHGEADDIPATEYSADLLQWRSDFDADLAAIDGHKSPIQAIFCQVNRRYSLKLLKGSAFGQVLAHRTSPLHHLVGAKYQLPYIPGGTFHMLSEGYHYLGEMHSRTYKAVLAGLPWNPVIPKRITSSGLTITVPFFAPVLPLVWDVTQVARQPNYGFTVKDQTSTDLPIKSVQLTGPDTVTITLYRTPVGKTRVRYGQTTTTTGNLRDSDPLVSTLDGFPLANWCVWFDDPVLLV